MRHVPRIVYAGTELVLSLPQRPWTPESVHVGGGDRSASGVPETFTIRRDELLELRIRFLESEWSQLRSWLAWAQESGSTFRFYSDRDEAGYYTVYLERPGPADPIRPERDAEYGGAYEIAVTLRRASAGTFYEPYYG